MMQGTTPKHTFTLPFDTSVIGNVRVLYKQGDKIILKKEKADCTLDGNTVAVTLTQEDTFKFDHSQNVEIQIRVLTLGGDSLVSNKYTVDVGECLDKDVMV